MITVVGFGGRAPSKVLEVVSQSTSKTSLTTINPIRSQNIAYELTRPPYRTFLTSSTTTTSSSSTPSLTIYCLPPSITEYLNFGSESSDIRTTILNDPSTIVAIYDTHAASFLGGTPSDILSALTNPSSNTRSILAAASLKALAELELRASHQLSPSTSSSDPSTSHTVVVVGAGGREHALAVAIAKSPLVQRVLCCPGNGGTAVEGGKISNVPGYTSQDNETVVNLVREVGAHTVVVGPEQPLVDGIVDVLEVECPGVRVFGCSKAGSVLESSKAFTKDFLTDAGIPTAKYQSFTDAKEAIRYVEQLGESERVVVKASGLAAGKGVLIPTTKEETVAAVKEIMEDKSFGDAGDTCVVESFLTGPEASCFAFCDGKTAVLMPAAQDHKRALDNDQGLNTGGMGAYCPAPCVTPDLQREIEGMCRTTVEKMAERGTPYIGLLYAGLMLTPDGPYMLEYNCRFGDPETQAVLPLLETDLYEIVLACCDGTLDSMDIRFRQDSYAATVVCAAKGYPEAYPKNLTIHGLEEANALPNVKVYHAGTKLSSDGASSRHLTSGGRVLSVTGIGPTLSSALTASYSGVDRVTFSDNSRPDLPSSSLLHNRTDVGARALKQKLRIGVLGSTRGTALLPILTAIEAGVLDVEVVAVVSNRSSAGILEKGRAMGKRVTTKFVSAKGLSREEYDAECTSVLVGAGVEYVVLVGYMRILSEAFCGFWKGRCVNVHPSLLPLHAGGMDLAVHQAVIDAGDKVSGCTIHEVTEEVDGGPILVQKVVKVSPGETAESLKAKVQPLEGPAYVEAIQTYLSQKNAVSYADAGVSIDAGNQLVETIKPACKSTRRPGCDSDLGGFGGLFDLAAAGYDAQTTTLVGATDGVGTKLRIAQAARIHDGVGIDLVAMCVNDLIVAGAEPLFFLDYYATGKLEVEEAAAVVKGIAEGCRLSNCGLIGGETAEMPSMYAPGDYDLAGFSVGAVNKGCILPQGVGAGDVLFGLESSGVHSNGFSLVRKLLEKEKLTYDSPCPWDTTERGAKTVAESLLTPTKIYVRCCMPLLKNNLLNAMAHITGGGLLENLPRSLPQGIVAEITGHPPLPSVFKWLQRSSGLSDGEMLRTFNCGIGMVLVVKSDKVEEARSLLKEAGEVVHDLGKLVNGNGEQVVMKASLQ